MSDSKNFCPEEFVFFCLFLLIRADWPCYGWHTTLDWILDWNPSGFPLPAAPSRFNLYLSFAYLLICYLLFAHLLFLDWNFSGFPPRRPDLIHASRLHTWYLSFFWHQHNFQQTKLTPKNTSQISNSFWHQAEKFDTCTTCGACDKYQVYSFAYSMETNVCWWCLQRRTYFKIPDEQVPTILSSETNIHTPHWQILVMIEKCLCILPGVAVLKFIVILWAELGGGQMAIWAREASSKWHCCCLLHTISVSGLFLKTLLEMHTNCSGQFVLFPSSRFKRPCMRCEFTGAQKFYAKLFEICNAHNCEWFSRIWRGVGRLELHEVGKG